MNLFDVYTVFPINIIKGKGCYVYDDCGNSYLDFYGGHAVISIGHSHPYLVKCMSEQMQDLMFYSNSVVNKLQEKLAYELGEISGYPDYSAFLSIQEQKPTRMPLNWHRFIPERKRL